MPQSTESQLKLLSKLPSSLNRFIPSSLKLPSGLSRLIPTSLPARRKVSLIPRVYLNKVSIGVVW